MPGDSMLLAEEEPMVQMVELRKAPGVRAWKISRVKLAWNLLLPNAVSYNPVWRNQNGLPANGLAFAVLPSFPSSRLILSSDVVERRCEVRRGDFGCVESCSLCAKSPFVSVSGTAGTGG